MSELKPDYDSFLSPNMSRVCKALDGEGEQKRIANVGVETVATLLRKNTDYGGSVFQSPPLVDMEPGAAILVRLGDKFERLKRLSSHDAEVNESLEDTIRDIAGYAILYLAQP